MVSQDRKLSRTGGRPTSFDCISDENVVCVGEHIKRQKFFMECSAVKVNLLQGFLKSAQKLTACMVFFYIQNGCF